MTFAHRLSLMFIFFMLLGCVIQFWIFDRSFLSHTNFMMLEISKQTAKHGSEQIEKDFGRIYKTLDKISTDEKIRDNRELLDEINKFIPEVDALLILDKNGEILAFSGTNNETETDFKDTKYFEQAVPKKAYTSDVRITETGKKVIYMSVPVLKNGSISGAVVGIMDLSDNGENSFENSIFSDDGSVFLLDAGGALIYGADSGQVGEKNKVFDKLRGESGSRMTNNAAGEKCFTGYSKVDETGWLVVVNTPVTDIIKNRDIVIGEMLMLFILENIVFIAIAVYIIKRYTRSTEQLITAFNSIKEGNYKRLNAKDYKAEFRKIVDVYNAMVKKVAAEHSNLSREANIDVLTHAYNRRAFDKVLHIIDDEVNNNAIEKVGCLLLDLDHFKEQNDSRGHLSGDKILQEAVKIMEEVIGERSVFRFGGDEFAILKRNMNEKDMLQTAENIRIRVAEKIEGCTISIGAASLPSDTKSVYELFPMADKALYASKIHRNTVTAYRDVDNGK